MHNAIFQRAFPPTLGACYLTKPSIQDMVTIGKEKRKTDQAIIQFVKDAQYTELPCQTEPKLNVVC